MSEGFSRDRMTWDPRYKAFCDAYPYRQPVPKRTGPTDDRSIWNGAWVPLGEHVGRSTDGNRDVVDWATTQGIAHEIFDFEVGFTSEEHAFWYKVRFL